MIMKQKKLWMMVAVILFGSIVLSSCSSDNEDTVDVKVAFEFTNQETINCIIQRVKADMEAVNFKDLIQLNEALKDGTANVCWTGTDSTGVQEIIASLQSLLNSIFNSENPTTHGWSWNFSNLSKTLQLATKVGLAFEKNADGQYVGERKYTNSLDVVVNDTLTYKITHNIEMDAEISLAKVGNVAHRKLIIDKNESRLLVIDTNQDFDASMNDLHINAMQQSVSNIDYKDMRFSLARMQYNTDSVTSNLVYSKEGSKVVDIRLKGENGLTLEKLLNNNAVSKGEMETSIYDGLLALKSNIDNMSKFYMAGLGLAAMGITGGSKEECQELTDAFNTVVNSKLLSDDMEVALMTFEPIASDSLPNIYRPELVMQMLPIDESSEKIPLKDFLEMIGLSFEDIINMNLGQNHE